MWTNYHCHTSYCDGKQPVSAVVATAVARNMLALGLSSHAPLPFERAWAMKGDKLDQYLTDIESVRSSAKLQVYAGLEVDYIPRRTSPALFRNKLDYTVGSVHFVDWLPNGEGWEIDGTFRLFEDGLSSIFHGDIRAAVSRYFELTREMITVSPPDIVGHLDKMKMHNRGDRYFRESDEWYQREVTETLNDIREAGCIVEVNTRGLYQNKVDTTYPSPWILQEIYQRNIPITLSSDAHHPDDLTNRFEETAVELLKIGFKKIRILLDGRWTDVPFDEHGINLRS